MKGPKSLLPGGTVGLFAPSNPLETISNQNIAQGLQNLENLGYHVRMGRAVNCPLTSPDSPRQRAEDLMELLVDDSIDGVLAVIGGYNSIELLPYLDYEQIARCPKPIIGFSDVTALLNVVHYKTGMITFLGPNFAIFCQLSMPTFTVRSFQQMMAREVSVELAVSAEYADDLWYLHNNAPRQWKPNTGLHCYGLRPFSGRLVGGNLETLLSLAGTDYFPDTRGKVLLIEEANAKPEALIRRELVQLREMGALSKIEALVCGRFWGWSQQQQTQFWEQMLSTVLWEETVPLLTNVDFGHTDPMLTLPIGGQMTFDGQQILVSCGDLFPSPCNNQ